tara:strand:+ start:993 stop:1895 length:903 start_codon:yes stop_codon:yes gene_type:complete
MNKNSFLIVSGTHGNEINPIFAVKKFEKLKQLNSESSDLKFILGNPNAYKEGKRYIDIDLNRSFNENKGMSNKKLNKNLYELSRARELLSNFGPESALSYQTVIDLHTTTSCMGTSVVLYGRRPKDFCLAALLQSKFGLPIYLYEKDFNQTGFLVEAWPCGLVIEIGPVAQNHYDPLIVESFLIILNYLDSLSADFRNFHRKLPKQITVFVHQKSIDYPRDHNGEIIGLIHPSRVNQDWIRIQKGDPLFLNIENETISYEETSMVYPVFIGEAAYKEKNIAMSFTKREIIEINENRIGNF